MKIKPPNKASVVKEPRWTASLFRLHFQNTLLLSKGSNATTHTHTCQRHTAEGKPPWLGFRQQRKTNRPRATLNAWAQPPYHLTSKAPAAS